MVVTVRFPGDSAVCTHICTHNMSLPLGNPRAFAPLWDSGRAFLRDLRHGRLAVHRLDSVDVRGAEPERTAKHHVRPLLLLLQPVRMGPCDL